MWAVAGASALGTICGTITENRRLNLDHDLATDKIKKDHEFNMTRENNSYSLKNTELTNTVTMHSRELDSNKTISLAQIKSNEDQHLKQLQQNFSTEQMKLQLKREQMYLEDTRKNKQLYLDYATKNRQLQLEYNDHYEVEVFSESDEGAEQEYFRKKSQNMPLRQLEFQSQGMYRGRPNEEVSDESDEDYENYALKRCNSLQKTRGQSIEPGNLRQPSGRRVDDEEMHDRRTPGYLDFGNEKKGRDLSDEFHTMTMDRNRGSGRQNGTLPTRSKKGSSTMPRPRERNSMRAIRYHNEDDENSNSRPLPPRPALTWK